MSGFSHFVSGAQSVVSNVQTLVSTFKTAKDLCSEFRRWRKEKKRKQGRSTNPVPDEENLERSLDRSGPRVQREYDRYFYYMGPRFADGDGKQTYNLIVLFIS